MTQVHLVLGRRKRRSHHSSMAGAFHHARYFILREQFNASLNSLECDLIFVLKTIFQLPH